MLKLSVLVLSIEVILIRVNLQSVQPDRTTMRQDFRWHHRIWTPEDVDL